MSHLSCCSVEGVSKEKLGSSGFSTHVNVFLVLPSSLCACCSTLSRLLVTAPQLPSGLGLPTEKIGQGYFLFLVCVQFILLQWTCLLCTSKVVIFTVFTRSIDNFFPRGLILTSAFRNDSSGLQQGLAALRAY